MVTIILPPFLRGISAQNHRLCPLLQYTTLLSFLQAISGSAPRKSVHCKYNTKRKTVCIRQPPCITEKILNPKSHGIVPERFPLRRQKISLTYATLLRYNKIRRDSQKYFIKRKSSKGEPIYVEHCKNRGISELNSGSAAFESPFPKPKYGQKGRSLR